MSASEGFFQNFKQSKQLPVLFLSVAGIVAVLFSFGYLLKYYVADFVGTLSVGVILVLTFSFLCSIAFFIIGLLLYPRQKFKAFASGLISLSVLLNYLLIYFLSLISSNLENVFAEYLGTILIFANTLVAITVAIRNKDKILSLFCITGGALTPLFFEALSYGAPIYFWYLFLLSAASLYVANALKWSNLAVITFLVTTFIVEYFVLSLKGLFFFEPVNVAIYHVFAYLYVFYFLHSSLFNKAVDKQEGLAALPSNFKYLPLNFINIGFLLINLFFYFGTQEMYYTLGIFYLLNVLPLISAFHLYRNHGNRNMQLLMLSYIALLLLLVVVIFSPANTMGIFWLFEAIVFVYLGYTLKLSNVRKIGYAFALIATLGVLVEVWGLLINHGSLLSAAYLNLLALGLALFVLITLYKRYVQNNQAEYRLFKLLNELFSIWIAVFFFITLRHFTFKWMSILFVVPSLYLFYRAKRKNLKVSRYVAYIIYISVIINAAYWAKVDNIMGEEGYFTSHGFWNIVAIGLLLKILQMWKSKLLNVASKTITVENENPDNFSDKMSRISVIRIIDVLFYWWLVLIFSVTFGHFNPALVLYVMSIPVLLLFYKGYHENMPLLRFSGFLLFAIVIYRLLKISYSEITEYWGITIYHLGTLNLLWTIGLLGTFILLFEFILKPQKDTPDYISIKKYTKIFTETLIVLIVVFSAIITYHTVGVYVFHLAALPMFGLLYYGHKKQLPLTEMVGMGHFVFMGLGVLSMYQFSVSPLRQAPHLILLIFEIYGLLLPLKYFFDKFMVGNKRQELVERMNTIFFFLMPFGFLFVAGNLFKGYFGFVLWGALAINFVCAEISRKGVVYYQIYFWLILSLFNSVYMSNLYFALTGAGALWAIVVVKGGLKYRIPFNRKIENHNTLRYGAIPAVAYYFSSYCIYLGYLRFLPDDKVGAYLSATLFLLLLTYKRNSFYAIRTSYRIAYRSSAILLPVSLLLLLASHNVVTFISYTNTSKWAELLLLPAALGILTLLLYKRKIIYVTDKNLPTWKMDMYLLHLCFMGTYVFFLSYFKIELYKITITTLWFLHAIILLFYTVRPKLKFLVKLSYLLFAVAMYKLFVNDFKDLDMFKRIIILLVLGMMFLGASFIFVKWKERGEKKNH